MKRLQSNEGDYPAVKVGNFSTCFLTFPSLYSLLLFTGVFFYQSLFSMEMKECPGCAIEVEAEAEVCPYCGYEFPKQPASVQIMAWVMIILLLLWLLF